MNDIEFKPIHKYQRLLLLKENLSAILVFVGEI